MITPTAAPWSMSLLTSSHHTPSTCRRYVPAVPERADLQPAANMSSLAKAAVISSVFVFIALFGVGCYFYKKYHEPAHRSVLPISGAAGVSSSPRASWNVWKRTIRFVQDYFPVPRSNVNNPIPLDNLRQNVESQTRPAGTTKVKKPVAGPSPKDVLRMQPPTSNI